MALKVLESQVEDALATYPDLFASLIGIQGSASLLLRQHHLASGRLDLLYASGTDLLLAELKVELFQDSFLKQVLRYAADLRTLQETGSLIRAPLRTYLLCPWFSETQTAQCRQAGVTAVEYSPERILQAFFSRLRGIAKFVSIKPSDHGVWNIHLIQRVLYGLLNMSLPQELAVSTRLSVKTVMNHLRFAEEMFLVSRRDGRFTLSALGVRYVASREGGAPIDVISEGQREILRGFIIKDPFASPAVFGIYAIVESVFTLARNSYPVDASALYGYFRDTSGKATEWLTETSLRHGVGMYSNYAIELGLLAKTDDRFLLTPDGIRFVLLLQLHKGIAMVDAIGGPNA